VNHALRHTSRARNAYQFETKIIVTFSPLSVNSWDGQVLDRIETLVNNRSERISRQGTKTQSYKWLLIWNAFLPRVFAPWRELSLLPFISNSTRNDSKLYWQWGANLFILARVREPRVRHPFEWQMFNRPRFLNTAQL
jgi:hypothetical protein